MIFDITNCGTDFMDMLRCVNGFTDIGFGGILGVIFMIVYIGVMFMMMKGFGNERSLGVTFLTAGVIAFFFRRMSLLNDKLLIVFIVLAAIGAGLLVKEAANYES